PAGASRTASCSTTAKEWLAAPPAPLGYPNLKPTTTTAQPTTPASKSCVDHETASTPFVLALRAPGAACGPRPAPDAAPKPPAIHEDRPDPPVDGPAPLRNGTTDRFRAVLGRIGPERSAATR